MGVYEIESINAALNGGGIGRHPQLFPVECFIETLPCYLPNGIEYRRKYIETRIQGKGLMISSTKSYDFSEIKKNKSHEEVFFVMRGTHFSFWGSHTFNFFFGWICIVLFICINKSVTLLLKLRTN